MVLAYIQIMDRDIERTTGKIEEAERLGGDRGIGDRGLGRGGHGGMA